ncbi:sugar ABC transporter substrate-binding protein [Aphanothece hegewaldii CCALA 016]|uniref:Sugar ABC transporter substrate-binding protein n=1 Tax=Aphanothece hegewaldii CCALA 016 TaxID=2107694 RepID=A0A2T1LV57_9CHRO|nr:polysaccharide biosynthesis/export family protein [Aphanothece hegewaldii]PSF35564.1 sugar ABC transporter substrate-binding protein [Aphanothece hegewaldii CCALA 016]
MLKRIFLKKTRNSFYFGTIGLVSILTNTTFCFYSLAQESPRSLRPVEENPRITQKIQSIETTNYTLGAGDRISVSVFQVADFSGERLVLADGTITMPLLGMIKVAGLTTGELSDLLSKRYANFLKRPIINVNLLSPRPLQVAIAGEINNPGSYTLALSDGKFPLLSDLIRSAGGITTVADIRQIELRRNVRGTQKIWTLNLWDLILFGNLAQDVSLRDGDQIVIPTKDPIDPNELRQLADANFGIQADREISVTVIGEVNRPGSYKVSPDTVAGLTGGTTGTTKRQPPRLTLALRFSGGIKQTADVRRITVNRYNRDGSLQALNIDLWNLLQTGNIEEDIILQEGDMINIPKVDEINVSEAEALASASFSAATIRVNVVGEVEKPGFVEIPPNTPLNQAIAAAGGFDHQRADARTVELLRLNGDGSVTRREIKIDLAQGITPENNPSLQNNDVIFVERNRLTAAGDTLSTFFSPIGAAVGGFFSIFNIFSLFGR